MGKNGPGMRERTRVQAGRSSHPVSSVSIANQSRRPRWVVPSVDMTAAENQRTQAASVGRYAGLIACHRDYECRSRRWRGRSATAWTHHAARLSASQHDLCGYEVSQPRPQRVDGRASCGVAHRSASPSRGTKGFTPLKKRWVIERTNAWNGRYRRNSKDYERSIESSTAMIQISHIHLMLTSLLTTVILHFTTARKLLDTGTTLLRGFRIASDFIPITSLTATESSAPGSYGAHSRVPSRHRGHPPSINGSGL